MSVFLRISIGLLGVVQCCRAQEPLRLEPALQSAMAKVERADSRVALAQSYLQLLESQNRRRIQFRPTLGLFSFSNPALLAANLGAGLTFAPRSQASPLALQNARFDLARAKLSLERDKFRAQIDTVRHYFDVLEKQEIVKSSCATFDTTASREPEVRALLRAGSLMELDLVRYEESRLSQQLECGQARSQKELGDLALASLIGSEETQPHLLVADVVSPAIGTERPLPLFEVLFQRALAYRAESSRLAAEVESLRENSGLRPRPRMDSPSFEYRYVGQGYGLSGNGGNVPLLGGHILQFQLPWTHSLDPTGERSAEREIAEMRIRQLQLEIDELVQDLRHELQATLVMVSAAHQRLDIARKKNDLAVRRQSLLLARVDAGLEASPVLLAIDRELAQARADMMRASYELKSTLFTVFAMCGVHDRAPQELDSLLQVEGRVSGGIE